MKKQNKRNQFTRMALALLLILSMLGNTLIFPTVAQETVAPVDDTTSSETPSADEATTDAISTPTLPEPILLTAADIPEFISAAALTDRGAVERMRSEETNMSSVIFRNSDGTRTMYMYGLPVKYTAADGTVRDKSTNLVSVSTASVLLSDQPVAQTMSQMSLVQQEALQAELGILDVERAADTLHMLSTALATRQRSLSDMAYTTLDNDVYALFPTNLAKGMTLVFGEHSVRMTPAGTGMTVTAGGNVTKTTTSSLSDADVTERLLYPNVFGLGTAVQYTPTLTGVKEEILLSRNVGKNSFAFLLETGGLVLAEQSGQFVLIDSETEQQVGKLGEIIVFDSAGQVVRGNMTAQTILAGQKYGITISVDQEFLASATYPVSIDPTISTVEDIKSRTIEDMGVYNHEDAWGSTFNEFPYVGKTAIDDYTGVLLYRFPFIYNSSLLPFDNEDNNTEEHENHKNDVLTTAAQIGSAKLTITVAYSSQYPITLGVKQSSILWSTNGMRICDADTYTAAMSGTNILSSTDVINSTGTVDLDVTEIMRAWFNYENGITHGTSLDPEKGFVLFSNNPAVRTQIGGVTGYTDSEKPFLTIDYITEEQVGPYYINNKESHQFLLCTDPLTMSLQAGRVADLGTDMEWMLYYMGGSNYALTPADHEGISFINSEGTLSIATFSPEPYCQWTMMTNGTDFVFRNAEVTDRVFSYVYDVEYSLHGVGYTTLPTSITIISDSAITNHSKWRVILKSEYMEFSISAFDELTLSPYEEINIFDIINFVNYSLLDVTDWRIAFNHQYISENGGTIMPVQSGVSCYITFYHYVTDLRHPILVNIEPLPDGLYYLGNSSLWDRYITIDSSSLNDPDGAVMELVDFTGSESQLWNVTHLQNGYYKIASLENGKVLTASTLDEDAIVLDDYTGAYAQQWLITFLSDRLCRFSPRSAMSSYLSDDLFYVITTTAPSDDEDKWRIVKTRDVSLIALPETYDRTSFFPNVISHMCSVGYDDYYENSEFYMRGTNQNELLARMAHSKMIVIRTHGSQTSIATSDGDVSVELVNNLAQDVFNYSELIILGACLTGLGKENGENLVNAIYEHGAGIVIGFEESVWNTEVNDWCKIFFQSLSEGRSVIQACGDADDYIKDEWYDAKTPQYDIRTDSWYITGNPNTTFFDATN